MAKDAGDSGRAARSRSGAGGLLRAGTWVIDLDGVVWLAGEPIPGAGRAIQELRSSGADVLFASNNSSPTISELLARLSRAGIDAGPHEVVTSAQAAASMLEPGQTAFVVGDQGVVDALFARGLEMRSAEELGIGVDAVVVGWTQRFDFEMLTAAMRAVRAGARLIGTNEDPTHPTPDGLLPGGGALLAAVSAASGVRAEVAGKPHRPLANLIVERAERVAVVVGDRPSTDGALARQLRVPFALVLTGVTRSPGEATDPVPDFVADDLSAVVEAALR